LHTSTGAKERIRSFLRTRIGQVVTSAELKVASGGASEWARRLRELRDEEGWPIRSHNDDSRLHPGEYILEGEPPSKKDVAFARNISAKLKAEVFDRNGFTCQMCGATPGEIDAETGRKVRLHVGHIVDKSLGGRDELSNLRTLCSSCNQGAKNITTERPTAIWLLAQVRRAGIGEQRTVFEWLKKKFRGA
jgi:hypothetical protein